MVNILARVLEQINNKYNKIFKYFKYHGNTDSRYLSPTVKLSCLVNYFYNLFFILKKVKLLLKYPKHKFYFFINIFYLKKTFKLSLKYPKQKS
jgi:hypothetical protein